MEGIQKIELFSKRIPVQILHDCRGEKTPVYAALHEIAFEARRAGSCPQPYVDPPVPSIIVACRADPAFISFSKSWVVHEFMIMDRSQSVLIINVTFLV